MGKLKNREFENVCSEYIKRINTFAKLEIIEVQTESSFSDADKAIVQGKEEERIQKIIGKKNGEVVLLSEEGRQYSSSDLADIITKSNKEIIFIIGGSFGFSEKFKKEHTLYSLSLLTFPHELARVILIEQLYRAITLNQKGNKYHK